MQDSHARSLGGMNKKDREVEIEDRVPPTTKGVQQAVRDDHRGSIRSIQVHMLIRSSATYSVHL
jgi:hypothetical protein